MLAAPRRPPDHSEGVRLQPAWRPGDVLGADRGFCSYAPLALRVQAGVPAGFRRHQKPIGDLTPGRSPVEPATRGTGHTGPPRAGGRHPLGADDQRVHWRKPLAGPQGMAAEPCVHLPDRLEGRALQYRVQRKGLRVTKSPLVTTLLDATLDPVEA
jgi:hypothetical protein